MSAVLSGLRTLLEVWGGINLGFCASLLYGLRRLFLQPVPKLHTAPALCILRPCEGGEPGLFENLLSSLQVAYPGPRRVLFLVPDAADPAYAVASSVARAAAADPALRGIDCTVLVTVPRPLVNRKVAQLLIGLANSDEELVVCADSDVRLQGDDLSALVAAVLEDTERGAAFAAPIEVAPQTFWDRASAAVTGGSPQSFLALYGLSALLGGWPNMAGALCVLRRSALKAIGGLEGVSECLGEDNEIARLLVSARPAYRVALSRRPARCHDGGRGARAVIARVGRWLMVVRAQRPLLLPTYPLLLAATPALLLAAVLVRSPILVGFTAAGIVLRGILGCALRRFVGLRISFLHAVWEVFLGEGLLWLGFLRAACSRRICWRGHLFYVERGGRLRSVS